MMFTTPPMASEPYSTDAGPLMTSMRSMREASMSMGEPDMDLCSEIFCPSMSTSVRKASSPRMEMRFRPCEPSFCTCTPGTSSSSSPTVRAPDLRTSSAVITVTLMGTCCSSFSTRVAVTYTSPAFTVSSARASGAGSSAQASSTVENAVQVIVVFFIIPSFRCAAF